MCVLAFEFGVCPQNFQLLFGAEIIDAKSIHRRDGDGGSDTVDRQRRSGTGTTGASGPDFGASQLQRRLAGAEHRVLEPGESFGGRISKGIVAARRDRHDSSGQSVVRGGTIPYLPEALA